MKYKEALILWDDKKDPKVIVTEIDENIETKKYRFHAGGKVFSSVLDLDNLNLIINVLNLAIRLSIYYNIPMEDVHEEFKKIDEYKITTSWY